MFLLQAISHHDFNDACYIFLGLRLFLLFWRMHFGARIKESD
jgi:hypothetical protein